MRTFFLLLFLPIMAKSQLTGYHDGFLVKNSNDTIFGYVKNRDAFPYRLLRYVMFKPTGDSQPEYYDPEDLKEFQIGDTKYVSRYLKAKKKNYFFEFVSGGRLKHYELEFNNWGANNNTYYTLLQKDSDEEYLSFEMNNPLFPFRRKIVEYLKEAPELCNKISSGIYNQGHLKRIIRDYNDEVGRAPR
jgi:hypothetical protein